MAAPAPSVMPPSVSREGGVSNWATSLAQHRRNFRQSKLQWTPEHVLAQVVVRTRGRLEFTTLTDLQRLSRQIVSLEREQLQIRISMGDRLVVVNDLVTGYATDQVDDDLPDLLGMDWLEAAEVLYASYDAGADERRREHRDVTWALRDVPFRTPLVEAWELKQLSSVYAAVRRVMGAAQLDLVEELRGRVRASSLAAALQLADAPGGLDAEVAVRDWVDDRLDEHGPAGGPLRAVPSQVF